MPRSHLRRVLAAFSLALLLTALAACGSEPDPTSLPDAAGATSDGASPDDAAESGDADAAGDLSRDDALLKFAQCMREHGVDMPDPEPGGGIRLNGQGLSEEQMRAAEEACQQWMDLAMPEDGAGPQMAPEDKEAMLALAQCMRDKGYDFPDPQFEGGRVTQRVEKGDGSAPGPDDPQFQADHDECATQAGVDTRGMGMRQEGS